MKCLFFAMSLILLNSTTHAKLTAYPAVVYSGIKFDKSFNESVYNGMEKFRLETEVDYVEFVPSHFSEQEQALRDFAQQGYDPIIAVGFNQVANVDKVASEYPDTRFTLIDGIVNRSNVQSVIFKEHEGSFLVGVIAAMISKTGKFGFVGGMDTPLIHKFACGYAHGIYHVNPNAVIYRDMTGTTPAAWNDPERGGELAQSQIDRGADVIFAAAGNTGPGVLQVAADNGKFSIGVDANQNYLHPGSVLTSMLKRVDVVAYETSKNAMDGRWKPGLKVMGLRENGVGWALDEHNQHLINPSTLQRAKTAETRIIDGNLVVQDYMTTNSCTYYR